MSCSEKSVLSSSETNLVTEKALTALDDDFAFDQGEKVRVSEDVAQENQSLFSVLERLLKSLAYEVIDARRRVEAEERVHLAGLERGFIEACGRIRTLDPELARVFRPLLLALIANLDELKAALIRQRERENAKGSMPTTDSFSRRSRAVGAYGRAQDGVVVKQDGVAIVKEDDSETD
ncbi:hypothetical protein CCP2SC5_200024 [Azospirillaceae bacterium]